METLYAWLVTLLREHRLIGVDIHRHHCECGLQFLADWNLSRERWEAHLAALAVEQAVEVTQEAAKHFSVGRRMKEAVIAALGEVKRG